MSLIKFILFIIVSYSIFLFLDTKYKLTDKYEDKSKKGFRKIINIGSIASIILILFIARYDRYFSSMAINGEYIEAIFAIPLVLRSFLSSQSKERDRVRKEELKKSDVEIKYCYYCGSEIDGSSTCSSCGNKLDL